MPELTGSAPATFDALFAALPALVETECQRRGLTHRAAARELGFSPSTITRIIQGHGIDARSFCKVLKWLDLTAQWLSDPQEADAAGATAPCGCARHSIRRRRDMPDEIPQINICGGPTPNTAKVTLYPYVCPYCDGTGQWSDGERCMNCHGYGLTEDVRGWEESEITHAPTPPAVMRNPCVDCAYRPGSPEEDSTARPGPDHPFFCHHGMFRVGDGYVSAANLDNGLPLGAMVCAGWWALAIGQPLPEREFRDPGGSDRRADAPETATEP